MVVEALVVSAMSLLKMEKSQPFDQTSATQPAQSMPVEK